MENRRFILMALIGVVLFFIYQAWQKEHAPAPVVVAPAPGIVIGATDERNYAGLYDSRYNFAPARFAP